jgi:hypothetical protein
MRAHNLRRTVWWPRSTAAENSYASVPRLHPTCVDPSLLPQKAGKPARFNDCGTIGSPAQATILHGDHVVSKPCQFCGCLKVPHSFRSRHPTSRKAIEGSAAVPTDAAPRTTAGRPANCPSAESVLLISEDRECRPVYALCHPRPRLIARLRAPLAAAIHQPLEQSGVQAAA